MKRPTKRSLNNRAEMLKTLKLAYQNMLDEGFFYTEDNSGQRVSINARKRRLTDAQAFDLGYRLATYWDMKP